MSGEAITTASTSAEATSASAEVATVAPTGLGDGAGSLGVHVVDGGDAGRRHALGEGAHVRGAHGSGADDSNSEAHALFSFFPWHVGAGLGSVMATPTVGL